MHPRNGAALSPTASNARAKAVLAFIRERGTVHPREVDAEFAHGVVVNYWGGSSSATTRLLEAMHYKGLLRVARREAGIRIYALQRHGPPPQSAALRRARLDALVDVLVRKYSPIPSVSLSFLLRRLSYAVPQWRGEIGGALERARHRLSRARVDGETWYWPSEVTGAVRSNAGRRAAARSVRPGRLGSTALRAALGMGLSLRGVHAAGETQAWLLCAPAPLARSGHRVGEPGTENGSTACRVRLCQRREAASACVCARTRDRARANAHLPPATNESVRRQTILPDRSRVSRSTIGG